MAKLRVGIVGIGAISGIYLDNLTGAFSDRVEVTTVTDLVPERASEAAKKYGAKVVASAEELVADEAVDLVLNLTIPKEHFEVAMPAVRAGKHVYNEKPLCIRRDEAAELLAAAEEAGVRVGCSPDTVLGAGIQTCRKLLDDGWIGAPVAATAFMVNHGHESWHPDPEFYYQTGGGPMFDMGPYYLSTLVNLMGPAVRLSGSAKKSFETRTITSEKKHGKVVPVEVPTHVAGTVEFETGAVATVITSFDIWASTLPRIEIYGTEGSLLVPDPNTFGGPVMVRRAGDSEWSRMPLTHDHPENSRGLGVADIAECIGADARARHRANGEIANHVLEIMHGFHDAAASGRYYELESSCRQPDPRPMRQVV